LVSNREDIVIIPWGSLVNSAAIIVAGFIGLSMSGRIPERYRSLIFQLFGLCLIVIGLRMVEKSSNIILVLLSCVLGGLTGELLKLNQRLEGLGDLLKRTIKSQNPLFTDGLITSSVMVCVGAMAIVGSFEEGLGHGRTTVYTKTLIDFFAMLILASKLGSGVIFSSVAVLLYQGLLTIMAGFIQPYLSLTMEHSLEATGGILVMGIAFNMLGLKPPIVIASAIPALVYALILAIFWG
jgi:uncharacterized membrane protein YqgA involved in biofilm formation